MTVAVHAFVTGRVQGVGFRWTTRERARRLGLAGWVRNLRDGRVELVAEGDADDVRALVAWLESRDAPGRVDAVAASPIDVAGLGSFDSRPSC